jgi:FkbM family methyltransferase
MFGLLLLRIAKAGFSIIHPRCWSALVHGVAPSIEHRSVLRGLECDLLLDVGANRGQFSLLMRLLHPRVPIHAYEPLRSEASVYRNVLGDQLGVVLHEVALADKAGIADLHISRRADSSSLLPIGELQVKLFPMTATVGICRVPIRTLDHFRSHWACSSRALLKLDVQGFELAVLRGARRALRHCMYVYAECSEMPLYTNQALFPEVAVFLESEGFSHMQRVNEQWMNGQLVQADHLFVRTSA